MVVRIVITARAKPTTAEVGDVSRYTYAETKPYVRQAYLVAGDAFGLVVQSREGGAPPGPFQRTVILQSQPLG
jgi:hypothetical protein